MNRDRALLRDLDALHPGPLNGPMETIAARRRLRAFIEQAEAAEERLRVIVDCTCRLVQVGNWILDVERICDPACPVHGDGA